MKKLTLVLALGLLGSCKIGPSNDDKKVDTVAVIDSESSVTDITIKTITIKEHEYMVLDGYRKAGICHSESCPCKTK